MSEFPEYKEHAGACKACGNSPCNHHALYFIATLQIFHAAFVRWSSARPSFVRFEKWMRTNVTNPLMSLNARVSAFLGIVTYTHDPTKARTYRSQVIWEEAIRRGIRMEQLCLFGCPSDTYRAFVRGEWVYFESLPISPELPQHAVGWIDDKLLLNQALAREGIAVPKTFSVHRKSDAISAFQRCEEVVVKPRHGSRARHTTTRVSNEEDVLKAFVEAQQLCHYVLVCEQLWGSVCRGTVVQGKLVGFFQANPPRLTGDGISTIESLIARANAAKHERVEVIVVSDEHLSFLSRLGYTMNSILEEGKRIDLTHRTGRLFGGETRELLPAVHPRLKAYLEKAARILTVPIVGFDLIIENPEADPDGQKWGIIEGNSLPFIDLHYLPLHGEPSNVAAAVWDLWQH